MALEGTYTYTDKTLEFTVSKITVRSVSYDWDEEAEDYVETSEIVTVELNFSFKIDASMLPMLRTPEYTDIMTMTEEELMELVNTIYENGSGIFGSMGTPDSPEYDYNVTMPGLDDEGSPNW